MVGKLFPTPIPTMPTAPHRQLHDAGRHRRLATPSSSTTSNSERARHDRQTAGPERRSARGRPRFRPGRSAAHHSAALSDRGDRQARGRTHARTGVHATARRRRPASHPGRGLDFRDEVMAHLFDRGDPTPKRTLTFNIELTDEGETTGTAGRRTTDVPQLASRRQARVRQRRDLATAISSSTSATLRGART